MLHIIAERAACSSEAEGAAEFDAPCTGGGINVRCVMRAKWAMYMTEGGSKIINDTMSLCSNARA